MMFLARGKLKSGVGNKAKNWKNIIVGKAHGKTPGHKYASYKKAVEMAKSGKYSKVYVNKGLSNEFPGVSPNNRPDVWGVRLDGKVDMFEVPSITDSRANLVTRLQSNLKLVGDRAGSYDIINIE